MSARPIGYYVHHHGDGHRQRALAIAEHMRGRIVMLGTGIDGKTGAVPSVVLPDDRLHGRDFDGADGGDRPDALHYAPLDHEGVRRRVAAVAAWIAEARPALMIVDVSVEIAMLARLASVPTVYVRLGGRRDDPAHEDAFRGARALLAPFHPLLDDPAIAPWVRARTIHAPGLTPRPPETRVDEAMVLGVVGQGGGAIGGEEWAEAARATPDRRWRILGPCTVLAETPPNLECAGWIADPTAEIARAGIVVGAAGDGLVSAVIAAGRPFVCLPQDRPFGEQRLKARRLAAIGAAVVRDRWPPADAWPAILEEAGRLDRTISARLDDPRGAERAAARILALADGASIAQAVSR